MSRERSHRDVDPQQFILIKEDLQKKKKNEQGGGSITTLGHGHWTALCTGVE